MDKSLVKPTLSMELKMTRYISQFRVYCIFLAVFLLPAAAMGDTQVLAFGDSITAGVVNADGELIRGYETPLQGLLSSGGQPSRVYNNGVHGENTAEGVGRLQRTIARNPYLNYVLILEGTNDLGDGISEQTTIFNLKQMANSVKGAGMIPIISNLTPDSNGPEKHISTTYNPDIAAFAVQENVLFADNYSALAPNWSSLTVDGTHPNQEGYNIMARVWYNAMSAPSAPNIPPSTIDGGGDTGGGGGGGCFIATAAFGSLLEPQVVLLQQFRDTYLLTNRPGRIFVRLYYRYSPALADCIKQHEWLKAAVRTSLYPLIGLSYLMVHGGVTWMTLFLLVMVLLSFCLAWPMRHSIRMYFR